MELGRRLKQAYAISIALLLLLLHINASLSLGHHHANVTGRCLERERDALLAIKGDLVDEYSLLSSWGSEDCCGWERVHCDHQTGHVIQLHLGGVLAEELNSSQGELMLKTLGGEISPKIIELQYLEYLDLSYNSFNATQIPALICSLSHLRHLDLHSNSLNGSKIPELIGNLTNLRYLDLSDTSLDGEIPTSICSLSSLRHLDLRFISLIGSKIPELIGNMTNLRYLDLSFYAFPLYDDEIPTPYQLENLTHLQYLNLAYTPFDLGNLNWLPHLSSLKYLDLSGTNLSKGSDWLETINKLPNLRNLTLRGCDLPPPILSTLSHINSSNSLVHVDLYGNLVVSSSIFKWLCNYNTILLYVDLSYNQLSGSISDVFRNMSSLAFLDLSYNQLSGLGPNAFTNMSSLAYLNLSNNHLSGLGPNVFANMSSLTYLDLYDNQLSGMSPNAFANMSSLAILDLSRNPLEGGIPTYIAQLCSLQHLSMSGCNLTGQLSKYVQRWSTCPQNPLRSLYLLDNNLVGSFPNFTNFSSLEDLSLSENKLSGRVSESIGKLSSLRWLDVSKNQLRWTIPESIGELSRLYSLGLSGNLLSGKIPESIGNLSSLEYLDLSKNQLSGGIPNSIGHLSNLWYINLSMNHLKEEISEIHFTKLSILHALDLSYNSGLEFNVTSDWIPPFNLNYLSLRFCKAGPNFPKWLQTQKDLAKLDMSYADISDVLPSWFWSIFGDTLTIDFSNNQIRGIFASSEIELFSGVEVRFSSNQLEGPVPSLLSNAPYLDLSDNKFSEITSFLCSSNVSASKFIDLSKNNISGEVPDCWRQWANLELLDLSFNAFSGKIPHSIGYIHGIKTLKLRSNKLTGALPSTLKNCTSLNVIDLGNNQLSSSVPDWIGASLPDLVILMLQSNQFGGSLPSQLCHLAHLQILDVSVNEISGTIPKCLHNLTSFAQEGNSNLTIRHSFNISEAGPNMTSLYYDDDETFMWKGTLASYKSTLGLVKRIDLSSNRLTGEIPSEITYLVGLISLNLSRNYLSGQIPLDIGKLKSLDSLDLSINKINGGIPTSLVHIDRLTTMNLSYNNLSGEIPTGTQLQGFSASSYFGNPWLCGPPLHVCDPKGASRPNVSTGEDDADELITQGFYISLGIGFGVGFWGICGSLIFKRSWRYAYYNFLHASNDWLYEKIVLIRRQLKNLLKQS